MSRSGNANTSPYVYDPATGTMVLRGTESSSRDALPTQIGTVDSEGNYLKYSDGTIRDAKTGQTFTQGEYNQMMTTQSLAKNGLNADGSMRLKDFQSNIDPTTGYLKGPLALNEADYNYAPTTLNLSPDMAGYNALKGEALRTGPSQWAQLALQKNQLDTQNLKDSAARQAVTSGNAAYNQIAMNGGARSGAQNRIGYNMGSALLQAKQQAQRAGMANDLGVQTTDEQNRLANLKGFQAAEAGMNNYNLDIGKYNTGLLNDAQLKNLSAKSEVKKYNIQNALTEGNAARDYDKFNYEEYNKKWAAGKQAQATASSGGGGGGGCCFIFLEARYGNGTMDKVVRRFRDENMTEQNRRGYYKLSEVFVPLMRKSKIFKKLVQVTMTSPLVCYGKAYYGESSKLGLVFRPVVRFWLGLFHYLGDAHPFTRENGETV